MKNKDKKRLIISLLLKTMEYYKKNKHLTGCMCEDCVENFVLTFDQLNSYTIDQLIDVVKYEPTLSDNLVELLINL